MVCLYCSKDTGVINSRLQKKQNQVWRRRQCLSCGSIFTTLEKPDHATTLTVKTNTRYKPFVRDKLWLSIYDSLKHRKTALIDATALTDTVIAHIYSSTTSGSIDQEVLANVVQSILQRFDKAAATYYLAYHPG